MTIAERSQKNAETITGLPVDELRGMGPEEDREHCEKSSLFGDAVNSRPMPFRSKQFANKCNGLADTMVISR